MKKPLLSKKEDEDQAMVKNITKLIAERRQAEGELSDLQRQIDEKKGNIETIQKELESLIGVSTKTNRQEEHHDLLASPDIPASGIVHHMIKYLEVQKTPMTTDEIFDAVKAQVTNRKKPISLKSIGSYLSNLQCFESIKKKDIIEGKTSYKKSGWVLNEEALKQK